jgi:transketolase
VIQETGKSAELARKIRISSLQMTSTGGSSHLGSCLSIADVLAVLYSSVLTHSPQNPHLIERDRLVLSKGHAGAALYATLAHSGYFDPSELRKHYQNGSIFSGHVSHKGVPGVEISTGSLGHGLSIGAGFALADKIDGLRRRCFVIMSDGECDEGSIWEAALFAGHHLLDSLVSIIDYNKIQSLGDVKEVLDLEPFADKWRSFGWDVEEIDGHNHLELGRALEENASRPKRPLCVIAHTVKGKGVSFMENSLLWHYRTAKGEEFEMALAELERK